MRSASLFRDFLDNFIHVLEVFNAENAISRNLFQLSGICVVAYLQGNQFDTFFLRKGKQAKTKQKNKTKFKIAYSRKNTRPNMRPWGWQQIPGNWTNVLVHCAWITDKAIKSCWCFMSGSVTWPHRLSLEASVWTWHFLGTSRDTFCQMLAHEVPLIGC